MLVVTLWLIITLAMLAAALGNYLSSEATLTRYHRARAQAKAWARAGVYLALERLALDGEEEPGKSYDWLGDGWAYRPSEDAQTDPATWVVPLPLDGQETAVLKGQVAIQITDEERKLNVNRIEEPNLYTVFNLLFGETGPVDLIADYVDQDGTPRPSGLESQPEPPPPYDAKNASIAVIEEIREIPGVSDEVYAKLQQYVSSALSAESQVNINTASFEVLSALFQAADQAGDGDSDDYPGLAQQVLDFRWDPSDGLDVEGGNRFTQLEPPIQVSGGPLDDPLKDALTEVMTGPYGALLGVQSRHFAIVAVVQIERPTVRHRIEALVERQTSQEPIIQVGGEQFRILSWKEW